MATLTTTINVKVSWWYTPLIKFCLFIDRTRLNINTDKTKEFCTRNGIKIYTKGKRIR